MPTPEDLLGLPVKHNLFDEGLITRIENGHMFVQFSKEFKYPDALSDEILTIADEDLRQIILEELEQEAINEAPPVQPALNAAQPEPIIHWEHINHVEIPGYKYVNWVRDYPHHVVIMREKFMYNGHYESAEIIARLLGYQLYVDRFNRPTAGGPDEAKIARALEAHQVSYIIVDGSTVIDGMNGRDAFKHFGISVNRPWEV